MSRRSAPRTFDEVLADIRRDSKTTTALGAAFEKIMLDFFRTDRYYHDRFVKVYRWNMWPGNKGEQDTGVDLVAEEADGTKCAIQCKCYDEETNLVRNDIAKFVATAKTKDFDNLILVYTGKPFGEKSRARKLLDDSKCKLITKAHLRDSSINWGTFPKLVTKKPKKLYKYQQNALIDVIKGFDTHDRGKLIMACGTGKTLVSLHIAERIAGKGSIVLYLVPSISLILQSMREWSNNAHIKHRYFAVCSDKSAGGEEGTIVELECPASTTVDDLRTHMGDSTTTNKMTVVFSTYHSIKVASNAFGNSFDLIFCDEAHRTAAVERKTHYTYVHNKIKARKRLYMTATPKIYGEAVKVAARERARAKGAGTDEPAIYDMDDKTTYGPEFHRLGFVEAVKYGALADFKVIIPMVSTEYVDTKFQQAISKDGAMPLDERTLLAAVWHGIQNPEGEKNPKLLQRVIAFTNRISSSKTFAGCVTDESKKKRSFKNVVNELKKLRPTKNNVEVRHIDGSNNALNRREEMAWLGDSEDDPNTCRILSNARCLSEGVDVPALDGVIFLNPRESIVDIVQSVGRVMRISKNKEKGYVVLPVAIPAGIDENKALESHPSFRTVWQVLRALRSHDETLAHEINTLILDKNQSGTTGDVTRRISFTILGAEEGTSMQIPALFDKITSKVVEKVGDIDYYDTYGGEIGKAAATVEMRIINTLKTSKARRRDLYEFHESLKQAINDSVTHDEAIRVIAQHVVLARVFDELFSGKFTSHNPISKVISHMAASFGLDAELEDLEGFYASVKKEVSNIKTSDARQNFIKIIYGNFFKSTTKKETEKHGVVYTPIQVVDFIIYSVQDVLKTTFGMDFGDRRVKILEPFAGTGTFITRLLDSGMLGSNTYDKYRNDLLANEMILLAYYVATVNIETTYSSTNGGKYVPFEGISYTDTLRQNPRYLYGHEHKEEQITISGMFKGAHERVKRQRKTNVNVIIGNPPYSAQQDKYGDSNPNTKYEEVDQRIADTYAKNTNVQLKNSLYDSYIRSLRWASDRIGIFGIVAFVTNAGFIRSEAAAGIRASLEAEFDEIWCLDLRGNARRQGPARRKEGGNVFGEGSRAPVAVTVLVKVPQNHKSHSKVARIRYNDIGDYLDRDKKLKKIQNYTSIQNMKEWEIIKPDKYHDWLDQRDDSFENYLPMGSKDAKSGKTNAVFRIYSGGIVSSRDAWAYNSSSDTVAKKMEEHIEYCNAQDLEEPIMDVKKAQWSSDLTAKLRRGKPKFQKNNIRYALYRPFFKQYLYFDKTYIGATTRIPYIFPKRNSKNLVICVPHKAVGDFSVLMTDLTPDYHVHPTSQCFPLYTYEGNNINENITNSTLNEYRIHYKNTLITKKDIFFYVYGLLHHTGYVKTFANNLSKDLPRIPMASNFKQFKKIGNMLADLHLNFETCKQFNLGKPLNQYGSPTKLSFGRRKMKVDKTKIKINNTLVFENIPQPKYKVNGRTPLEWIVDRYKITVDNDSLIINNPLKKMNENDVIALIERAVYIGMESDRLIAMLPKEFEPKGWKPPKTGLDAHISS